MYLRYIALFLQDLLCNCTDVVELKFQVVKVLGLLFNENKVLFILVLHKLDLRKVKTKSRIKKKAGGQ